MSQSDSDPRFLGGTASPPVHLGHDNPPGPQQTRNLTTTLITGANKGLGYETARRLIKAGPTVWMGARDAWGQQARVNATDPGYTATDLNENRGTQTVQEGTEAIVELATRGGKGPTGTFINRSGVAPFWPGLFMANRVLAAENQNTVP